jgi:hypothetical protein
VRRAACGVFDVRPMLLAADDLADLGLLLHLLLLVLGELQSLHQGQLAVLPLPEALLDVRLRRACRWVSEGGE